MTPTWPDAHLDNVRRAKVLAESIPGAAWAEAILPAPFERTWSFVTDFEHSVPQFDTVVRRIRMLERGEHHARWVTYNTALRLPWPFEATIEPGFCIMRSK